MNARRILVVAVALNVIAIVLFVTPCLGPSPVVAQEPITPADEASRTTNPPRTEDQGVRDTMSPNATEYYYHMPGSGFMPRRSAYGYTYSGSGCMYPTVAASNDGFFAPVFLPPGTVLKFLRIYVIDNNATENVTAALRWFDDGASNQDVATISSSGANAGVRTFVTSEFTHTVNYNAYSYGVIVFEDGSLPVDGSLRLCGVRIGYYQGIFGVAMPFIMR